VKTALKSGNIWWSYRQN